jgi:hypothetical protein
MFHYDLHLTILPGSNQRTMICFHGYGANYQIAETLKEIYDVNATLVSFNFPGSYGTIDELLPALYVMKKIVLDQNLTEIDLYGFSAGGAAVVNVIGLLNENTYDAELKKIGIGAEEKKRLLAAIQKGMVILDAPLKSVEEIMDFRGHTEEFETLAKNYKKNGFRPLDSVKKLKGLSLNIVLYFDQEDEVLSNRDDEIFIERLRSVQPKLRVILGDEGGHCAPHYALFSELQ